MWLVRTFYGLSVTGLRLVCWALGLVLVVSRPVCTKHPDSKAGQPLDTDKPGCITSGWGGETDPQISRLFSEDLCLRPSNFAANHRVAGLDSSGKGVPNGEFHNLWQMSHFVLYSHQLLSLIICKDEPH